MTDTGSIATYERPAAAEPSPSGVFAAFGRFVTAHPGKVFLAWLARTATGYPVTSPKTPLGPSRARNAYVREDHAV